MGQISQRYFWLWQIGHFLGKSKLVVPPPNKWITLYWRHKPYDVLSSAHEADVIYEELCNVAYTKAPNHTEDLPIDHYMMEKADKLLRHRYVKDNEEVKKYIMYYLTFREVSYRIYD